MLEKVQIKAMKNGPLVIEGKAESYNTRIRELLGGCLTVKN